MQDHRTRRLRTVGALPGLAVPGLALLLLLVTPAVTSAQSGRLWQPEERVLITAFHRLAGVAADANRVYAVSPEGVQIYDFAAGRWEAPLTTANGFPIGDPPTALAHDPLGNALWLGTATGSLYTYRLTLGGWDSFGPVVPGPIQRIIPTRDAFENALYLVTPAGWFRVRRGSGFADRVSPAQLPREVVEAGAPVLERLERMDPYFQSARATLTLDDRLRRWPITDAVAAAQPLRFWISTDGGQLLFYDSRRMAAERLSYGLLEPGVATVATDGLELWFGGDGRGQRRGVARADAALQRWNQYEAGFDGAPGGSVEAIVATNRAVWFGATDGLFRFDRDSERWRRLLERDGLPDGQVTALAPSRDGVWVGTRRGAVRLSEAGEVITGTLLGGTRIHRMVVSRDTVWLATQSGLWLLPPGLDEPVRPPGAESQPALRGPVLDARPDAGSLWVLTEDALYRYDGAEWHGPSRAAAQAGLGRLRQLAAADGQFWVAGERGVGRLDRDLDIWTYYLVRQDIPEGPVRSILPFGNDVWVATAVGALRLRWRGR